MTGPPADPSDLRRELVEQMRAPPPKPRRPGVSTPADIHGEGPPLGYLHPRTEEYALSRWRMVAYYVALIVIGVASLTLDAVGAVAFGAGYAVTSTAGLVWRVRRMPHQESWAIVALAILSAGQGAALWAGDSPDGGVEHLLAAVRLAVVAPLMMIEHARLLQRLPRRTDVRL